MDNIRHRSTIQFHVHLHALLKTDDLLGVIDFIWCIVVELTLRRSANERNALIYWPIFGRARVTCRAKLRRVRGGTRRTSRRRPRRCLLWIRRRRPTSTPRAPTTTPTFFLRTLRPRRRHVGYPQIIQKAVGAELGALVLDNYTLRG